MCKNQLVKIAIHGIEINSCSNCVGAWFDGNELVDFLKTSTTGENEDEAREPRLTDLSVDSQMKEEGFCPKCNQLATQFTVGSSRVSVLRCGNCGGMWVALSQVDALRHWYRQAGPAERLMLYSGPREIETFSVGPIWKSFLGLIEDENPTRHFPLTTVFIILLNVILFIWSMSSPDRARFLFMVPRDVLNYPSENVYMLFTSMFMHGGCVHLLVNMYFLLIFGDNIEDRVGMLKYVLIYFSSGILAGLAHAFCTTRPEIPTLGASGAVSGIMGGYLLLYPRSRMKIFSTVYFRPFVMNLPIWFYLGVWFFGLQLLNASLKVPGVAWYAHIGGFICGYLTLYIMRVSNRL
jgi:membrane associated rhomboid family serine protease/Zn-finger nucleic acid-binding protein